MFTFSGGNDQRNTFMCIYRTHDKYSPELREVINIVKYAAFGVGLIGFVLGMGSTGSQFEQNHYHTKWRTRFTAVVSIGEIGCQGSHGTGMVPTGTGKTGKAGKMGRHFPVREKSGNFEQTGKVRENHIKYWKTQELQTNIICYFSVIFK